MIFVNGSPFFASRSYWMPNETLFFDFMSISVHFIHGTSLFLE